ncbi:hypothetical protein [Lentibacillus salinarum]|uniref:Replication factor A C-terminal domain-containing protein n=1 Tax=Lentibacillus salinarum TaxID=446820 RepID=A0ABW3ZZ48_9BACI
MSDVNKKPITVNEHCLVYGFPCHFFAGDMMEMANLGVVCARCADKYGQKETINYYVYKAKLTEQDGSATDEEITFCCFNVRLVSLLKEIDSGEILLDKSSIRIIHWTEDRNEASNMATKL